MKIFFIINRGRREALPVDEQVEQFRAILEEAGVDYQITLCDSVEHTEECLTSAIATGYDTLWVGGGDGTLNHALNFTFGKFRVYGIVPMGTVNALARSLGIPVDPVEAVKYLLKAEPVPMDVGSVAGRYFFTYATVGMHAAVFHNIDTGLKKRWGKLAFWHSAARTVWKKSLLPRFLMEMEIADAPPGEHIVRDYGYSFNLSNVANYAGFGTITNEEPASPGYFELHHFRRNRLLPMFIWFALMRLTGNEGSRMNDGHVFRLIRWVNVRSNKKLSVQVDGEPIESPDPRNLRFLCVENAVYVLLQQEEAVRLTGTANHPGLTDYHKSFNDNV